MKRVIVIGANRGIGLGFVKHYLANNFTVIATYRNENTLHELMTLKTHYPHALSLYSLDITYLDKINAFAQTIDQIDLLILNAGIKGYPISGTRPYENTENQLLNTLQVNTIAHDNIVRAFFPILSQQKNACVAYISSLIGQTADNSSGGYHPYRAAKAAANALIWNWCIELMKEWKKNNSEQLDQSPCAFAICPGSVRTDMTGPHGKQSVEESVSAMAQVIATLIKTKQCNGLYMYDGRCTETYAMPAMLKEIIQSKVSETVD